MIKIPEELAFLEDDIKKTNKPFVRVDTEHQPNDIGLLESKFGGRPFFTSPDDYPKSSTGKDLIFLAQLNFSDIPHLDGFPEDGLVQFFISGDELFGMGLSDFTDQSRFRVNYISGDKLVESKGVLAKDYQIPQMPDFYLINGIHKMKFEIDEAPVTLTDYRCKFDQNVFDDEVSDKMQDFYWDNIAKTALNKIGGYGHFVEDPRYEDRYNKYSEVLLQVLSSEKLDKKNIDGKFGRWTLHFLIKPDDLKRQSFEDVIYTWAPY